MITSGDSVEELLKRSTMISNQNLKENRGHDEEARLKQQ
jgi:hypothetical protein